MLYSCTHVAPLGVKGLTDRVYECYATSNLNMRPLVPIVSRARRSRVREVCGATEEGGILSHVVSVYLTCPA